MEPVSPLPTQGAVFFDPRTKGASCGLSFHDDLGVFVLSLWRDDTCLGTFRLAVDEAPRLIHSMVGALVGGDEAAGTGAPRPVIEAFQSFLSPYSDARTPETLRSPRPGTVTVVDSLADGGRLEAAQEAARRAGVDALLVTPGPDLRYLTGYHAIALERLTCLVVPAEGDPVLVAPGLEVPAAQASPLGRRWVSRSAAGPRPTTPTRSLPH